MYPPPRTREHENRRTAFRRENPVLRFSCSRVRGGENVRGNHSNRATAAHPNPRKQNQPAFSVENTGWCLRRMWDLNPRGS
ncbi:hypothetical protein FGA20_00950 [Corynebacterium diphtheriae bv. mitis]|nr:hypothetical protein FGA20_00950 [Corynebacterium diphtheriae bv. mitis]